MQTTEDTTPSDDTIAELFARDPLHHSDQDILAIIKKLRSQRARFVSGNKSAGTPGVKKSAATKKQEAALKVAGQLDLGDLGLDI